MNIALKDASKMRTVTVAFTENQVESMLIDHIIYCQYRSLHHNLE